MDCKIELIFVPVTDVNRAIDFCVAQGNADVLLAQSPDAEDESWPQGTAAVATQ